MTLTHSLNCKKNSTYIYLYWIERVIFIRHIYALEFTHNNITRLIYAIAMVYKGGLEPNFAYLCLPPTYVLENKPYSTHFQVNFETPWMI